jgi:methionyl-tRNA synthetase
VARFYLTTAIDYANGDPHIGHALEKIGADAIARYCRLAGDDVWFLMGMDEHGQKVAQAAADRGITPQEFVDGIAARFTDTWERLNISYDRFIRTTEAPHKRGVVALIETIRRAVPDDFYEQEYEGWYCVGCELFKRENEIVEGRCVLHPTRELQWTKERNWFFRLSRYAPFLKQLILDRPRFIRPESRRNEILALIEQGLEDISVTRSRLSWAIPFPIPTSTGETQGTWVWFDALPNYLTATGYPEPGYDTRWPAQLHIVGKDITRLHVVVWPAMLHAAGLALPEEVWAHGFVAVGGERLSKSAGVKLDLDATIAMYHPDAFRYFLLREVPFDGDGSISLERFDERYNADLANSFGNLASRALSMIEKYCDGVVPAGAAGALDAQDLEDVAGYHAAMNGEQGYLLHEALKRVMSSVARGNEFIQSSQPWAMAKDPARRAELEATMAALARHLARHAILLHPFMPVKSAALWTALGAPGRIEEQRFSGLPGIDASGWKVSKGEALFPRAEKAGTAG